MSDLNPFTLIAAHFPYTKALSFSSHDKAALTLALIESIQAQVNAGQSADKYGMTAARHIIFLNKDFGLGYAAAYWENIRKVPKVRLNESFFKYDGVQGLVKEIIMGTISD